MYAAARHGGRLVLSTRAVRFLSRSLHVSPGRSSRQRADLTAAAAGGATAQRPPRAKDSRRRPGIIFSLSGLSLTSDTGTASKRPFAGAANTARHARHAMRAHTYTHTHIRTTDRDAQRRAETHGAARPGQPPRSVASGAVVW